MLSDDDPRIRSSLARSSLASLSRMTIVTGWNTFPARCRNAAEPLRRTMRRSRSRRSRTCHWSLVSSSSQPPLVPGLTGGLFSDRASREGIRPAFVKSLLRLRPPVWRRPPSVARKVRPRAPGRDRGAVPLVEQTAGAAPHALPRQGRGPLWEVPFLGVPPGWAVRICLVPAAPAWLGPCGRARPPAAAPRGGRPRRAARASARRSRPARSPCERQPTARPRASARRPV